MNEARLEDYFYYDETSPSCLRWKVNMYTGKNQQRLVHSAGDAITRRNKQGYYVVGLNRKKLLVHRVIWKLLKESECHGLIIDHIDRDISNNKIDNLRTVCKKLNSRNRKMTTRNSSGVNGVTHQTTTKPYGIYEFYVATWIDLEGKLKTKCFSVNRFGKEEALRLASEYRSKMFDSLNLNGAGYTKNHGGAG